MINFPNSPTTGQIFTSGSTSWIYDGIKWGLNTNIAVSNDSMPVGAILWYANTSTAPLGWIPADGSAVSRTTYATLFVVIGTTYGSGDGSTTFNVPSVAATTGKYYIRYTTSLGTVTTTSLSTSPVGTMLDWPTTSSYPTGYLRADGTAVSRTSYADLFSLIGTTYGIGDNVSTFNLPNLVAAGSGSPVKIIKASLGGIVEPSTVAHAASHIRGGSDIIDGDRVQVDYVPTNYTRDSAASGAGAVTDLTAHLSGIDMILPAGMLMPYAGSTEPTGWVFCYGQTVNSVSNTAYARLWTAIGTTYGGASASSFILPDLRGRAVFGKDNMGGTAASRVTSGVSGITGTTLGNAGGNESMQSHYHNYYRTTTSGGSVTTGDIIWSVSGGNVVNQGGAGYLRTDTTGGNTGTGASQNMPPTIITNYLIKL